jgi:hypothetical protein
MPREEHEELFERGQQALGELGYSLLRSEIYSKRRHRHRRITSRVKERQELEQELAVARSSGNHTAIGHAEQNLGLLVWEHIGVLAEFCEQLASMFHAVREHEQGSGDFGQRLLAFKKPAWRTVGDGSFSDVAWWTATLGIQSPVPRPIEEVLTRGPMAMAEAMFKDARKELPGALADVARTYTQSVHRVAQRRKHAYPLLTEYGFGWLPAKPVAEVAPAETVIAHTPFTVVDAYRGNHTGLSVPGDRWAAEQLLEGIASADWLLHVLSAAVLSAAENRTGLALVFMPIGEGWPIEDQKALLRAYTGYSDATHEGLATEKDAREAAVAAARTRLVDHAKGGVPTNRRLGRNEPCWCGSGKKFKRCHGR